MAKYKNKKVSIDDHTFDSKAEAAFYENLKLKQMEGEVIRFTLQPKYILQEKFQKNGVTYREIAYIADFEVVYADGRVEVVDVKGLETEAFKVKKKLFEYKYPELTLKLVTYVRKYGGWIEIEQLKKLRRKAKQSKGVS
jgi:hypothetical protein